MLLGEKGNDMIYKNFMAYGLGLIEGDPLLHYDMPVYTIKTTMPTGW